MTFLWPTAQMGMLHPSAETTEGQDRAAEFRQMAEYARAGVSYQAMKGLFSSLSTSAVETRVAAFAEVGLLYGRGPSVPLALTPVGAQLFSVMEAGPLGPAESRKATALLTWALSNCQINRPRSPGSPRITDTERKACDLRPYLTAWSLMLDLDGELYMHEFLGPVRQLQKVDGYDACVASIRAARAAGSIFPNPQTGAATSLANASIYWRSRLSVAGLLLSFDSTQQRLRFALGGEEIVEAVIEAQGGMDGSSLTAVRAKTWTSVDEYFWVAGAACSAEVTGAVIDALTSPTIATPPPPGGAQPPIPPSVGGTSLLEGKRRYRLQRQVERRSWVSREAKRLNAAQHSGMVTCEACDFGHPDPAMMDAHHKDPLAGGVRQTSVGDLLILCPTCHRRAHRTLNVLVPLTIAELRAWVVAGRQ